MVYASRVLLVIQPKYGGKPSMEVNGILIICEIRLKALRHMYVHVIKRDGIINVL